MKAGPSPEWGARSASGDLTSQSPDESRYADGPVSGTSVFHAHRIRPLATINAAQADEFADSVGGPGGHL